MEIGNQTIATVIDTQNGVWKAKQQSKYAAHTETA